MRGHLVESLPDGPVAVLVPGDVVMLALLGRFALDSDDQAGPEGARRGRPQDHL